MALIVAIRGGKLPEELSALFMVNDCVGRRINGRIVHDSGHCAIDNCRWMSVRELAPKGDNLPVDAFLAPLVQDGTIEVLEVVN